MLSPFCNAQEHVHVLRTKAWTSLEGHYFAYYIIQSWKFILKNKYLYSCKNLYINFHSNFIFKSRKLEIIQMSFKRLMIKQTGKLWHIHTTEYYAVRQKTKQLLTHATTWRGLEGVMLGKKKPILKSYQLNILFIQPSWNNKTIEMENRFVVNSLGIGGMAIAIKGSMKEPCADWTFLCLIWAGNKGYICNIIE